MSKDRIIDLQKQVKVARAALEKIRRGAQHPHLIAEEALDAMRPKDKPTPLAGLMGWERAP